MLVRANRLASKLQESLAEVGEEFLPLSEAAQGIGQSLGSELARLSPKMTKPGTKRSLLAQAVADVAAEAYQALSGKRAGYQNDPYHRGAVRGQFPAFLQTVFDALKMEDSAGNSAKAAVRRMRAAGSSI